MDPYNRWEHLNKISMFVTVYVRTTIHSNIRPSSSCTPAIDMSFNLSLLWFIESYMYVYVWNTGMSLYSKGRKRERGEKASLAVYLCIRLKYHLTLSDNLHKYVSVSLRTKVMFHVCVSTSAEGTSFLAMG